MVFLTIFMVHENGVLKWLCEMVLENGLFWPFLMKSKNGVEKLSFLTIFNDH